MTDDEIWNNEKPVSDILDMDIPAWIEGDISPYDIAAICQGGCASGAYMPAVTYANALKVMSAHGDDVLQYIEDQLGEIPAPPKGKSWQGMACFYLSYAVELWANGIEAQLEELELEGADQ